MGRFACTVWRSHHPVVLVGFQLCPLLHFVLTEGWPVREPVLDRSGVVRNPVMPNGISLIPSVGRRLDQPYAAPRLASSWGPIRLEFTNFHRARRSVGTRLARACVSRTEEVAAKEKREEDRAERKRIQVRSKILARTVGIRGENSGATQCRIIRDVFRPLIGHGVRCPPRRGVHPARPWLPSGAREGVAYTPGERNGGRASFLRGDFFSSAAPELFSASKLATLEKLTSSLNLSPDP